MVVTFNIAYYFLKKMSVTVINYPANYPNITCMFAAKNSTIELSSATVDMVNDDDYDLVSDSLLHHFVHLYRILIYSYPLIFQTNGYYPNTSGVYFLPGSTVVQLSFYFSILLSLRELCRGRI